MHRYQKRILSFVLISVILLSNASVVGASTYKTSTGENLAGIGRNTLFNSFYGESNDGGLMAQPDLTKIWEEFSAAVSELELMLSRFNSSSSEIGMTDIVKSTMTGSSGDGLDSDLTNDTVDYTYITKVLENKAMGTGRVEDLSNILNQVKEWDRSSTVPVYDKKYGSEDNTKTIDLNKLKLDLLKIEYQSLKVQALGGIIFSYDGVALQNGIAADKERTSTEAKVLLSIIKEHSKGNAVLSEIKNKFIEEMSGDKYKSLYTNDESPETQVNRMTDRNLLKSGEKTSKYLTNFFDGNQSNLNLNVVTKAFDLIDLWSTTPSSNTGTDGLGKVDLLHDNNYIFGAGDLYAWALNEYRIGGNSIPNHMTKTLGTVHSGESNQLPLDTHITDISTIYSQFSFNAPENTSLTFDNGLGKILGGTARNSLGNYYESEDGVRARNRFFLTGLSDGDGIDIMDTYYQTLISILDYEGTFKSLMKNRYGYEITSSSSVSSEPAYKEALGRWYKDEAAIFVYAKDTLPTLLQFYQTKFGVDKHSKLMEDSIKTSIDLINKLLVEAGLPAIVADTSEESINEAKALNDELAKLLALNLLQQTITETNGNYELNEVYLELFAWTAAFVPFQTNLNNEGETTYHLSEKARSVYKKYSKFRQPLSMTSASGQTIYTKLLGGGYERLRYVSLGAFLETVEYGDVFLFANAVKQSDIESGRIAIETTVEVTQSDGSTSSSSATKSAVNTEVIDLSAELTSSRRYFGPVYGSSNNPNYSANYNSVKGADKYKLFSISEAMASPEKAGLIITQNVLMSKNLTGAGADDITEEFAMSNLMTMQIEPNQLYLNYFAMHNVIEAEDYLQSGLQDDMNNVLFVDFLGNIVTESGYVVVPAAANAVRYIDSESYPLFTAMVLNFYPDVKLSSDTGVVLPEEDKDKYVLYFDIETEGDQPQSLKYKLGSLSEQGATFTKTLELTSPPTVSSWLRADKLAQVSGFTERTQQGEPDNNSDESDEPNGILTTKQRDAYNKFKNSSGAKVYDSDITEEKFLNMLYITGQIAKTFFGAYEYSGKKTYEGDDGVEHTEGLTERLTGLNVAIGGFSKDAHTVRKQSSIKDSYSTAEDFIYNTLPTLKEKMIPFFEGIGIDKKDVNVTADSLMEVIKNECVQKDKLTSSNVLGIFKSVRNTKAGKNLWFVYELIGTDSDDDEIYRTVVGDNNMLNKSQQIINVYSPYVSIDSNKLTNFVWKKMNAMPECTGIEGDKVLVSVLAGVNIFRNNSQYMSKDNPNQYVVWAPKFAYPSVTLTTQGETGNTHLNSIPPDGFSFEWYAIQQLNRNFYRESDKTGNISTPININSAVGIMAALVSGSENTKLIDFEVVTAAEKIKSDPLMYFTGSLFEMIYNPFVGRVTRNEYLYIPTVEKLGEYFPFVALYVVPVVLLVVILLAVMLIYMLATFSLNQRNATVMELFGSFILTVLMGVFMIRFFSPTVELLFGFVPTKLMQNELMLQTLYELESTGVTQSNTFFSNNSEVFEVNSQLLISKVKDDEAIEYRQASQRKEVDYRFYMPQFDSSRQNIISGLYLQNRNIKIDTNALLNTNTILMMRDSGNKVELVHNPGDNSRILGYYTPYFHFTESIVYTINQFNNATTNNYKLINYNGQSRTTGRSHQYFNSIFFIAGDQVVNYIREMDAAFSAGQVTLGMLLQDQTGKTVDEMLGSVRGDESADGDGVTQEELEDEIQEKAAESLGSKAKVMNVNGEVYYLDAEMAKSYINMFNDMGGDLEDWLGVKRMLYLMGDFCAPFDLQYQADTQGSFWYPKNLNSMSEAELNRKIRAVNDNVRNFVLSNMFTLTNYTSDQDIIKVIALKATMEFNKQFSEGLINNRKYPSALSGDLGNNDFLTKLRFMPVEDVFKSNSDSLGYYLSMKAGVLGTLGATIDIILFLLRTLTYQICAVVAMICFILMFVTAVMRRKVLNKILLKIFLYSSAIVIFRNIEVLVYKFQVYYSNSLRTEYTVALNLLFGIVLCVPLVMLLGIIKDAVFALITFGVAGTVPVSGDEAPEYNNGGAAASNNNHYQSTNIGGSQSNYSNYYMPQGVDGHQGSFEYNPFEDNLNESSYDDRYDSEGEYTNDHRGRDDDYSYDDDPRDSGYSDFDSRSSDGAGDGNGRTRNPFAAAREDRSSERKYTRPEPINIFEDANDEGTHGPQVGYDEPDDSEIWSSGNNPSRPDDRSGGAGI